MARRSGFNCFLVVGYGRINIPEVPGAFEATEIRISKVTEPTWKVSVARRRGLDRFLVVGYGKVDILDIGSTFKTTGI